MGGRFTVSVEKGDLIMVYPKPYSIYLRGIIALIPKTYIPEPAA